MEDFKPFARHSLCRDFTSRLQTLVPKHGVRILAWALMPNHFHLLIETGGSPIHAFMHDLLTGFCIRVNRDLERRGHVFMSRFKSILVERQSYLLKLVRYIHLNPVKGLAGADPMNLESFRWTGHPAILGEDDVPWQDTGQVLSMFSKIRQDAIRAYISFLGAGLGLEDEPGLEEGLFQVGRSGVVPIREVSTDQRRYDFVGVVLGSRDFAVSVVSRLEGCRRGGIRNRRSEHIALAKLLDDICRDSGIRKRELRSHRRKAGSVLARKIACVVLSRSGFSRADIGRLLGLTRQGVGWAIASYDRNKTIEAEEKITKYCSLFNEYL
ncbi:hypothetical protein GX411_08535 [Candidatus Fermentibacteria bacterium]|nr:hypothetical protein [Candidatus Fermentibacteria bacterium]